MDDNKLHFERLLVKVKSLSEAFGRYLDENGAPDGYGVVSLADWKDDTGLIVMLVGNKPMDSAKEMFPGLFEGTRE